MSFLDALEKLRSSSLPRRRAALAVSVSFIMIIIIGLWMLQLNTPLVPENSQSAEKPLQIIWQSIKSLSPLNP